MGTNNKLYGNMTAQEIKEFEILSQSLVINNGFGENSLCIQESEGNLILFADKIDEENNSYPNLFHISDLDLSRLYNYIGNFLEKYPEKFQFIQKSIISKN